MIPSLRLACCLLLVSVEVSGQKIEFHTAAHKGNIWQSSPRLSSIYGQPNIVIVGVNYGDFSQRNWTQFYPGLRSGAEFSFFDFDNKEMGKAMGLSTFVALRIPSTERVYAKFNGGVTWVSNPYDPDENPGNPALGGPWAFSLQGMLYYETPLGANWTVRPGIALHHLSTCSYFQPNTGINVPSFFLEVGNRLPRQLKTNEVIPLPHKPGWDFIVQTGIGRKSVEALDRERFWVASANAGVLRRLNNISRLGLEASFVSSQADNNFIQNRVDQGFMGAVSDYKRLGLAVQHELVFGRVSFYNAIGYYVYDPSRLKKDWYQRYGLRYHINENFIFSPTMLAHLGVADFLELSMGYRFGTRRSNDFGE